MPFGAFWCHCHHLSTVHGLHMLLNKREPKMGEYWPRQLLCCIFQSGLGSLPYLYLYTYFKSIPFNSHAFSSSLRVQNFSLLPTSYKSVLQISHAWKFCSNWKSPYGAKSFRRKGPCQHFSVLGMQTVSPLHSKLFLCCWLNWISVL